MAYAVFSVTFGEQPSAAKWNILGTNDAYFDSLIGSGTAYTSWTPTWTNLTVGNGTVTAKYTKLGKLVICRLSFVMGSTSSISGSVSFTLPVTAVSYPNIATDTDILGPVTIVDSGTISIAGEVSIADTTHGIIGSYYNDASVSNTKIQALSSTSPMIWTTNDALTSTFSYEAA